MKKVYEFYPQGTCSRLMTITMDGECIDDVKFVGGCHGNLQGIAALIKGQRCEEVIGRLKGIRCGNKMTSCPDQLSCALEEILKQQEGE